MSSQIELISDLTKKKVKREYNRSMKTDYLELYTDYLISNNGYATATGLSSMMNNEVTHD